MDLGRRARDHELIDAIDSLERVAFEGSVWRAVREGRDPVLGHPSGGRWDPGTFDVVYTSLEPGGAIAELYFHLSRMPVFPTKPRYVLHEIKATTRETLELADLQQLEALGVARDRYTSIGYERTQEIGDIAFFLGFDGLIAPSARASCQNLVIFTERLAPGSLEATGDRPIDWDR